MRSLNASGAIDQYDRFIVTRSDYMHKMLHAPLSVLPPEYIWIPDGERYNGVTVRGFPLPQLLPAKWGSLCLSLGTVCDLKARRHMPGTQPHHCLQWAALRRTCADAATNHRAGQQAWVTWAALHRCGAGLAATPLRSPPSTQAQDRHIILPRRHVTAALDFLTEMVTDPEGYVKKLKAFTAAFNLEAFIHVRRGDASSSRGSFHPAWLPCVVAPLLLPARSARCRGTKSCEHHQNLPPATRASEARPLALLHGHDWRLLARCAPQGSCTATLPLCSSTYLTDGSGPSSAFFLTPCSR